MPMFLNRRSLPEFPAAIPLPGETIFLWIPWKALLLMPQKSGTGQTMIQY